MYELSTTHRAAALTWMQRDILLDLWEQDKSPVEVTTVWKIAQRLVRTTTSIMMSIETLRKRGLVENECIRADEKYRYIHSLSWFLTDDGIAAIKELGE